MHCDDVEMHLLLSDKMRPTDLCTGTKNVLLAKFFVDKQRILLSRMGSNCYKYMLEAADEKDIYSYLTFFSVFSDSDFGSKPVVFEGTGKMVSNSSEFVDAIWWVKEW